MARSGNCAAQEGPEAVGLATFLRVARGAWRKGAGQQQCLMGPEPSRPVPRAPRKWRRGRPGRRGGSSFNHQGPLALCCLPTMNVALLASAQQTDPAVPAPHVETQQGVCGYWAMGHPEEPDQTPCLGSPEAPEWDPQSVPFPRPALRRSLCCYLPRFGLNLRCAPRPPPPASFCQSCTDMQTCTEQPSSRAPQVASPALPCALASPCSSAESVNRGWWLSSSTCVCAQSERGFAPAPPVPHATCSPDVGWQYSLGMACCVSLCLCVSTAVGRVGYMSGGGPGWARGSQEGLPGTEDPGPQHTTCPTATQLPAAQACVGPGHRWARPHKTESWQGQC